MMATGRLKRRMRRVEIDMQIAKVSELPKSLHGTTWNATKDAMRGAMELKNAAGNANGNANESAIEKTK